MKRLLIFFLLLFSLARGEAQTTTTSDRVVTKSLYLRDWWVDSVKRDTNFLGGNRSIPTAAAVYNFVAGRGAPGYTSVTSLPDSSGLIFHGPNGVKDTVVFEGETGGSGSSLPSMTGNAGKVLTTDGTTASWGTVSGGATTTTALTDVSDAVPTNNATLVYNQDSLRYVPTQVAAFDFVDLRDGDELYYDSLTTQWRNKRPGSGGGTSDSIRQFSGAFPETGNIGINTDLKRIQYRVGGYVYTLAVQDSAATSGGSTSGYVLANTTAARAYATVRLSETYTGTPLGGRRSSDNTYADIAFDTNGEVSGSSRVLISGVDQGDLTTWLGGASFYVSALHDQSGNDQDATQGSPGQQPLLVLSGIGGKASIQFDGSDDVLNYSPVWTGASARSLFAVYKNTATGTFTGSVAGQWGGTGTGSWFVLQSRTQFVTGHPYLAGYSADLTDNTAPDTSPLVASAHYNGTTAYLRRNGGGIASGALTLTTSTLNAQIGSSDTVGALTGQVSAVVICNSYVSATLAEVESRLNTLFSVY
jgi:hypothetical protein